MTAGPPSRSMTPRRGPCSWRPSGRGSEPGMSKARTDNDTWEITESVGATALGVAWARAAETESENPMIRDPFARVFLDAAGDGLWNWYSASRLPAEVLAAEPEVPLQMKAMVGYMASRTAFF